MLSFYAFLQQICIQRPKTQCNLASTNYDTLSFFVIKINENVFKSAASQSPGM